MIPLNFQMQYLSKSVCSLMKQKCCSLIYTEQSLSLQFRLSPIVFIHQTTFCPRGFSTNSHGRGYEHEDPEIAIDKKHKNRSRLHIHHFSTTNTSTEPELTSNFSSSSNAESDLDFIIAKGTAERTLRSITNVIEYVQRTEISSDRVEKLRYTLEADSTSLISRAWVEKDPNLFLILVRFGIKIPDSLALNKLLHYGLMKKGADYLYKLAKGLSSNAPINKQISVLRKQLTQSEREFIMNYYPGTAIVHVAVEFIYLGDYKKAREYLDLLRVKAANGDDLQKIHAFLSWLITLFENKITIFDLKTANNPRAMLEALKNIPYIHTMSSVHYVGLPLILFSKVIEELKSINASPRMFYFAVCFFCPEVMEKDSLALKEAFSISKNEEQLIKPAGSLLHLNERLLAPIYDALFRGTSKRISSEIYLKLFNGLMVEFPDASISAYSFYTRAFIAVNDKVDNSNPYYARLISFLSDIKYRYIKELAYLYQIAFEYYLTDRDGYSQFLQIMRCYTDTWGKVLLPYILITNMFNNVSFIERERLFVDLTNAGIKFSEKEYSFIENSTQHLIPKKPHDQDVLLKQLFDGQENSERLLNFDNTKRLITQFPKTFCNDVVKYIYLPRRCERKISEYDANANICTKASIERITDASSDKFEKSNKDSSVKLDIPESVYKAAMESNGNLNITKLDETLRMFILISDVRLNRADILNMHSDNVKHFHDKGYPSEYLMEYLASFFKSFEQAAKPLGLLDVFQVDLAPYTNYSIVPKLLSFDKALPRKSDIVNLYVGILNNQALPFTSFKTLFENSVLKNGLKSFKFGPSARSRIVDIFANAATRFRKFDEVFYQKIMKIQYEFTGTNLSNPSENEIKAPIKSLYNSMHSSEQPFEHFYEHLNSMKPLPIPVLLPFKFVKRMLEIIPNNKLDSVFLKIIENGLQADYCSEFRKAIMKCLEDGDLNTKYRILRGHHPKLNVDNELFYSDLNKEERATIISRYSESLVIKFAEYWMTQGNEKKTYEYLKLCSLCLKGSDLSKDEYFCNQLRLRADILFNRFLPREREQNDDKVTCQIEKDMSNGEAVQHLKEICIEYEDKLHSYKLKHYSPYLLFKTHRYNLSRYRVFSNFRITMGYLLLYCPLSLNIFTELGLFRIFDLTPKCLTRDIKIDPNLVCPNSGLLMLTQIFRNIFIIWGSKLSEDEVIMLFDRIMTCDKKYGSTILSPKNSSYILKAFIAFASIQGYAKLLFFIYRCMIESNIYYDNMGPFMSTFLESLVSKSPKLCAEKVEEFKRKHPDIKIHYKTYAIMIKKLSMNDSQAAYAVYLHFTKDYPDFRSNGDTHNLIPLIKGLGWKKDRHFAKQFGNTGGKSELRVKVDNFNIKLYDYDKLGD